MKAKIIKVTTNPETVSYEFACANPGLYERISYANYYKYLLVMPYSHFRLVIQANGSLETMHENDKSSQGDQFIPLKDHFITISV